MCESARVAAVRDRAVANGGDPNGLLGVRDLVDDPVRTDPQGPQTSQSPAERVAGVRVALE